MWKSSSVIKYNVVQVKYVKFLHRLIQQIAAAHAYVSPQPYSLY